MTLGSVGRRLLAIVAVMIIALQGMAASDGPQPVFTSRSELVLVPAVVTDKSGNHVPGLTKEDFVVLEDGKPQPISVFEEIRTEPGTIQKIPSVGGGFGNSLRAQGGSPRLLIVALDMVNTPALLQGNAKNEVLKFLSKSIDPANPTEFVLITRGGLHVLHDFNGDPRVLAAALQRLAGTRNDLAEKEAFSPVQPNTDKLSGLLSKLEQDENESKLQVQAFERRSAILTTMQALQQIAGEVAGVPGRKALVWVSAGFPASITKLSDSLIEPASALISSNSASDMYRQTWQSLNQAQVAVYPVDVRYLNYPAFQGADEQGVYYSIPPNPSDDRYATVSNRRNWDNDDTISTFRTFADNTGGRVYYNSNDLQRGMQQALEDSASYYMIGYQLDRKGKKLGWHKLKVEVSRHGVEVRARNTFLLTDSKDASQEERRAAVRSALQSPVDFTSIAIRGTWRGISPGGAKNKNIAFELVMPGGFADIDGAQNNHMHVEFMVKADSDSSDTPSFETRTVDVHLDAKGLAQIQEHGLTFRSSLNLPSGNYNVRFVVLDALSGRVGSTSSSLKVD